MITHLLRKRKAEHRQFSESSTEALILTIPSMEQLIECNNDKCYILKLWSTIIYQNDEKSDSSTSLSKRTPLMVHFSLNLFTRPKKKLSIELERTVRRIVSINSSDSKSETWSVDPCKYPCLEPYCHWVWIKFNLKNQVHFKALFVFIIKIVKWNCKYLMIFYWL
jgi:hypothetical protein